jgi:RNA polymerase sigma factor for flagellar operon FliA
MNEGFFANILSMDEYMKESEDKEQQTYSIRDDKAVLPEEELLKEEMYENLAKVIENLNEKEQLVVSLFYKEDLTFTEIGHVMSLSTSRISQIHSKALYKMRHMLTKIMEQA